MGYTHYWSNKEVDPRVWAKLLADVQKIIKDSGVPIAGGAGSGEPELAEDVILFNGVAGDSYESFEFERLGSGFSFCKTARRPYDTVVGATLIRAMQVLPEGTIRVNSDGNWEEDWREAKELYLSLFGGALPESEPFSPTRDD